MTQAVYQPPSISRALGLLALQPCLGFALMTTTFAVGCGDEASSLPSPAEPDPWAWSLPEGFPEPSVPEDNPMTAAKVELGRDLFFDARLALNGEQSCASCHAPERAFSDGRARSPGSTGDLTQRSAPSLTNVVYAATLNWADAELVTLEAQAVRPFLSEDPVELGWAGREQALDDRLEALYGDRFRAVFPEGGPTLENAARAIAAFERTLISGDSPFDRYVAGNSDALDASALRGLELFFSEQLECFHCHGGFNFTQSTVHSTTAFTEKPFHNVGLYNVDGRGAYPERDQGLFELTGTASDMGKFRAPTLRNIAVTAPYMHDGSVEDLDAVLDHYSRGGRLIEEGPDAGDGRNSIVKSGFVQGFRLTPEEREDVKAFLRSLTDQPFLERDWASGDSP